MNITLFFIILITVILFFIYRSLHKNSFKAPAVIIGKRKYYDPIDRLYIDVVDYDGSRVYFKYETECEIADPQILPQSQFLERFTKVKLSNVEIHHENILE